MNEKKQLAINMIAQVVSFFVGIIINFFLTPYIIKNIGKEAYGFFGLANNFVSYADIIVAALNSMAARFITISFHQNRIEDTKKYYSSVFFSNIIIAAVLSIPATIVVINLERIVNVPALILSDVKLLWGFIFANAVFSIITSVYGCATYVKNRLELASLRKIEASILRVVLLLALFFFLRPNIYYLGLVTVICTIYNIAMNVYYTRKLLPEISIGRKYYDFSKVKELLSSGVWNSVSRLSSLLSNGLDLLITNLFVGASAMGLVSVSKVLHTYVFSLLSTISSVFMPRLTISYANKNYDEITSQLNSAMRISGFIACIPITFIYIFGTDFFSLWLPGEDAQLLQILSVLGALCMPFSLTLEPLWGVFTVTNKVKQSSMMLLISSCVSFLLTFVLLSVVKEPNHKLYVIVGVSTVIAYFKAVVFLPIYGAKCLGLKKTYFYPTMLKVILSIVIALAIASGIKSIIVINSWIELFFVVCTVTATISIVNVFVILHKEERNDLKKKIKERLR